MTARDGWSMALGQIAAASRRAPPLSRPRGVLIKGSASVALLALFQARRGAWLRQVDVDEQLQRAGIYIRPGTSRWCLAYLRELELIRSVPDGRNARYLRHTLQQPPEDVTA